MKIVIGIDPAFGSKGCAVCIVEDGNVYFYMMQVWELFNLIINRSGTLLDGDSLLFVIENSNLNKGNWHGSTARGGVAKNKAISQIIVDFCDAHKINYKEIPPNGYSVMAKSIKAFQADSGYKGRTNVDQRAAWFIARSQM